MKGCVSIIELIEVGILTGTKCVGDATPWAGLVCHAASIDVSGVA